MLTLVLIISGFVFRDNAQHMHSARHIVNTVARDSSYAMTDFSAATYL